MGGTDLGEDDVPVLVLVVHVLLGVFNAAGHCAWLLCVGGGEAVLLCMWGG